MKPSTSYLSGMNGIRAIACLLVLFAHLTKSAPLNLCNNSDIFRFNGRDGVTMFFVLSGFLITYRLTIELKKNGQINLKNFFMRRVLRILPLYYLYILISIVACTLFQPHLANYEVLPYYLLLVPNIPWIYSIGFPKLNHYWSLGVEEQFYLIWPILFRFFKNQLWSISIVLLLSILAFKMYLINLPRTQLIGSFIYALGFQHIFIGCLGALAFVYHKAFITQLCNHKILQLASWVGLIILVTINFNFSFKSEVISAITLVIIIGQVLVSNRVFNLEQKQLYKLGAISYGVYVYHPLVISFVKKLILSKFEMSQSVFYLFAFYFLSIGLTLVIASLSYKYFEGFFMNIKNKRYGSVSKNLR